MLSLNDCAWHIAENIIADASLSMEDLILLIKPVDHFVTIIFTIAVFVINHKTPYTWYHPCPNL